MTKDEALRMALDALQKIYIAPEHEEYIRVWWPACEQAITAIKEALSSLNGEAQPEYQSTSDKSQLEKIPAKGTLLAQPEQDIPKIGCVNHDCDKCKAQPEQEPVAWADHGVVNWIADKQFQHAALLYEEPQRIWVDLTDDEEMDIALEQNKSRHWVVCEAIRQFKEKNT